MPTIARTHRPIAGLVMLLAVFVATQLVAPAAAASKKSCAQAVIDDWYGNGKVDRRYPLHCYREAVASLNTEHKDYLHADEDILRALAYARVGKNDPGVGSKGATPGSPSAKPTEPDPSAHPPTAQRAVETVASGDVPSEGDAGVPLPLILLGGLALVLLAAGGAGVVSRRLAGGSETDES